MKEDNNPPRARFTLKRTISNNSPNKSPEQNLQSQTWLQKEISQQQQKVQQLLDSKNTSTQNRTKIYENLTKCHLEEMYKILEDQLPQSHHQVEQRQILESQLQSVETKSLAEQQLFTLFQILTHQSQTLLTTCAPLMIEHFTLLLLRKCQPNAKNDEQLHQVQLKVSAFGRELQRHLTLPFKEICQHVYTESHGMFIQILQESGLAQTLESQELSLIKHDYYSAKTDKENIQRGKDLVMDLNNQFPIIQTDVLRKQSAVGDSLNINNFLPQKQPQIVQKENQLQIEELKTKQDKLIDKLTARKAELLAKLDYK